MSPIIESFPLPEIRSKQAKAIDFVQRAMDAEMSDVVIEGPTGLGKAAVGIASGLALGPSYYFVTQKLLQDQLEYDFANKVKPQYRNAGKIIMSAGEYNCPKKGNCEIGRTAKNKCTLKDDCTYKIAKSEFMSAQVGVTNYAYYFTTKTHSDNLSPRKLAIFDECHNLPELILKFQEATVSDFMIRKYGLTEFNVPKLNSLEEHREWIDRDYIPACEERRDVLMDVSGDDKTSKVAAELEGHIKRMKRAVDLINPEWVFWQENDDKGRTSYASPTDAAPYFKDLIASASDKRIFMSAFPGAKAIFCREIGLDPSKTAWLRLNSSFDIAKRRITFIPSGSMGRANQDASLPRMIGVIDKLARKHPDTRGIIHSHSYVLAKRVYEKLRDTETGKRILFPENADQRDEMFAIHSKAKNSILMSPSFVEGYDFKDDLCRWQLIIKVPYASLGNLVVRAKKERDEDWYALQTAMKIVQASGRIVRSETDWGETYILDSDFGFLYKKFEHLFPSWWKQALCHL